MLSSIGAPSERAAGETQAARYTGQLGQEEFLTLMITQLENQDPFKPHESDPGAAGTRAARAVPLLRRGAEPARNRRGAERQRVPRLPDPRAGGPAHSRASRGVVGAMSEIDFAAGPAPRLRRPWGSRAASAPRSARAASSSRSSWIGSAGSSFSPARAATSRPFGSPRVASARGTFSILFRPDRGGSRPREPAARRPLAQRAR